MPDAAKAARTRIATAAMLSVEPVVEMLLEIGVSSREAESIFRDMFVRKAYEWLRRKTGAAPSIVQVSLITGVHRNFVARILAAHRKGAAPQAKRGLKIDRLIEGWTSISEFQDPEGKPADLSLRGEGNHGPSLKELVHRCSPGLPVGSTFDQLVHLGIVRVLPTGKIQLRGLIGRKNDLTRAQRMGKEGKDFLTSLLKLDSN